MLPRLRFPHSSQAFGLSFILVTSFAERQAFAQRHHPRAAPDTEIMARCSQLQWQPQGDALACRDLNEAPQTGLAIYGPDGQRRVFIASFPTFPSAFAWSPDGREIAGFTSTDEHSLNVTLSVVSADGATRRSLIPPIEGTGSLAWRPDGHEIAYSVRHQMFLVPSAGGEPRDLGQGTRPAWSPDGRSLAFARRTTGGDAMGVCLRDMGSGQVQCSGHFEGAMGVAFGPSWSPDGTRLAVTGWDRQREEGFLAVATVTGGNVGEFTQIRGVSGDPFDWSPDGIEIVTPAQDGRQRHADAVTRRYRLVAVRVQDTQIRTIVLPDRGPCRAWTPAWSSRGLAFAHLCAPPLNRNTLRIRVQH